MSRPSTWATFVEAARGHAVDASFVLVGLLVGDPDQVSKLLLGETEHDPFVRARARQHGGQRPEYGGEPSSGSG
jgi:hypothetical protein